MVRTAVGLAGCLALLACSEVRSSSAPVSDEGASGATSASTTTATLPQPPNESSSTTTFDESELLTALAGARWIVVEHDGRPWPLAYAPYLELESSPAMSGAIEPFIAGNDGCNWYSASGSLDHDRASITHGTQTAMNCGPGTGSVTLVDGDRLGISDDGTRLEVYGDGGELRLVFLAFDSLIPATFADLAGRWALDSTAPSPVDFGQDGTATFGPCAWSWTLDDRLAVGGMGAEPYACLDGSTDHTSSRFIEMLHEGPVSARVGANGELYLSDRQFVIKLRPSDVSPSEPASVQRR